MFSLKIDNIFHSVLPLPSDIALYFLVCWFSECCKIAKWPNIYLFGPMSKHHVIIPSLLWSYRWMLDHRSKRKGLLLYSVSEKPHGTSFDTHFCTNNAVWWWWWCRHKAHTQFENDIFLLKWHEIMIGFLYAILWNCTYRSTQKRKVFIVDKLGLSKRS